MDAAINQRTADKRKSGRSQRDRREASNVSPRKTPAVQSRAALGINNPTVDSRPLPRRRVDVPLSANGAEIRLPAVPAMSNRWRFL